MTARGDTSVNRLQVTIRLRSGTTITATSDGADVEEYARLLENWRAWLHGQHVPDHVDLNWTDVAGKRYTYPFDYRDIFQIDVTGAVP